MKCNRNELSLKEFISYILGPTVKSELSLQFLVNESELNRGQKKTKKISKNRFNSQVMARLTQY